MQKARHGAGTVSLIDIISHPKQSLKNHSNKEGSRGIAYMVSGAFFVVIFSAVFLNFAVQTLFTSASDTVHFQEKVAYQPGQIVQQSISEGYVGGL